MQTSFPYLRAGYGKGTDGDGRKTLRAPECRSKGCMLANSPFTCWAIETGSRPACLKRSMTDCDQIASEVPQSLADKSKICNHSR